MSPNLLVSSARQAAWTETGRCTIFTTNPQRPIATLPCLTMFFTIFSELPTVLSYFAQPYKADTKLIDPKTFDLNFAPKPQPFRCLVLLSGVQWAPHCERSADWQSSKPIADPLKPSSIPAGRRVLVGANLKTDTKSSFDANTRINEPLKLTGRGVEVVTESGGQGRKVAGAISTQAGATRTWSR